MIVSPWLVSYIRSLRQLNVPSFHPGPPSPNVYQVTLSTRWTTGMVLPSFMTAVRPAVSVSRNRHHSHILVAYVKLSHVISGVYVCVFGFIGRETRRTDIELQQPQLGNCAHG